MLKTEKIDYHANGNIFEGYLAVDKNTKEKKPAILIAHDWTGKNAFACQKAEKLAELGYVGFAIDMYGKGILGTTKEEKMELMQPLMADRTLLQQRILAAYEAIKKIDCVDNNRIGAIGFCFGGLCVLDLARTGVDVKGVISFHGLFQPPQNLSREKIKAKILALHGFDDPMVPPDQAIAFAKEMSDAKADWQLHVYGHTLHAFTNPEANDPSFGTVYNKKADARAWIAMKDFFAEVFVTASS